MSQLITTAPEMLKVLEFLLNDENTQLDCEARIMIEAVIKKAKGESESPDCLTVVE